MWRGKPAKKSPLSNFYIGASFVPPQTYLKEMEREIVPIKNALENKSVALSIEYYKLKNVNYERNNFDAYLPLSNAPNLVQSCITEVMRETGTPVDTVRVVRLTNGADYFNYPTEVEGPTSTFVFTTNDDSICESSFVIGSQYIKSPVVNGFHVVLSPCTARYEGGFIKNVIKRYSFEFKKMIEEDHKNSMYYTLSHVNKVEKSVVYIVTVLRDPIQRITHRSYMSCIFHPLDLVWLSIV